MVEFIAADLVDSHLIHLSKVLAHFSTEPVVKLHKIQVHSIHVFKLVSFEVLEISSFHSSKGIQVCLVLLSELIDLFEGFSHG